jgi:hypothetical protein
VPPGQIVAVFTVMLGVETTCIVVVADELQGAVPRLCVIVYVPTPAVAGLNIPAAEVPGPDQEPPLLTAVSCTDGEDEQKGPAGLIAAFGGPVCALPGVVPNCRVKLLDEPLQFSTRIINTWPAVTAGAGTELVHPKAFPN